MSLAEDFGMYYNGSYVGYRTSEGEVVPFSIDSVNHDHNVLDLRNLSSGDRERIGYSDAALDALVFHGTALIDGDYQAVSLAHNDERLILDLPDSKFIKVRNRFHWVSYRANRTTKKGITHRRMSGMPNFDWGTIREFFSETVLAGVFGRVFLRTNDDLRYKDVYVGKFVSDTQIELFPEAAHLSRIVTREIPQCQVTVQTEQQAPAI